MKLATILSKDGTKIGISSGGRFFDLTGSGSPGTMLEFVAAGEEVWAQAKSRFASSGLSEIPISEAKLLAPLPNPGKIIAIGLNYMDHCREQNIPVPERPLVFAKFSTAIIAPGEPISWDPNLTREVDYEAELGVVIGKRARNVDPAHALDYVFGYTIVNDISARDLQFLDKQWVRSKSLDTFCPLGPVIVTRDEIPDPQTLAIRCTINGQLLQDSSTAEMIFGVRDLIAYLSKNFTLEPGDLISTGTPDGVGFARDPQVFLKDGDMVVAEIEGIGRLENPVKLSQG
jgi:2-keto-4-pentenoate hydratase/2-oxohepta-3-ene-1,7-dioic acid hydratase in catechol pathway